mgnify:CR=1 FL=1
MAPTRRYGRVAVANLDDQDTGQTPFPATCYAPFTSLYFDVRGNVIACCQNTDDVLGNVNDATLRDIWEGRPVRTMRDTFRAGALATGCGFCAWEEQSTGAVRFARMFDHHPRSGPDPEWPVAMEFALSNRCNLACIMCNGDFSSTIRSQRERRPPLPVAYGEEFFAQLRPFLAHLRLARFFGGEPFLIPEYQRIWDLMIEDGHQTLNSVTTNGTVRTSRTEAVLDALPFSISVSIDGLTPTTIESVRQGADARTVLDNVTWFHRHCRERGTEFGLTYCLMTHNWHEFAPFLDFADGLDAPVAVNTVVYPPASSLFQLPPDQLGAVIDALEATVAPTGRNAGVFAGELERLRGWRARSLERPPEERTYFEIWGRRLDPLGSSRSGEDAGPDQGPLSPVPAVKGKWGPREELSVDAARDRLARFSTRPPSTVKVDAENRVTMIDGPGGRFLDVIDAEVVGRDFAELIGRLVARFGAVTAGDEEVLAPNAVERSARFGPDTRVRTITIVDTAGATGGGSSTTTLATLEPAP